MKDEKKNIKNKKIIKRPKNYRGYASTYNAKILNSFNIIVTTLVLEFKKVERANDKKHSAPYSFSKAETNIYVTDLGDAFE